MCVLQPSAAERRGAVLERPEQGAGAALCPPAPAGPGAAPSDLRSRLGVLAPVMGRSLSFGWVFKGARRHGGQVSH